MVVCLSQTQSQSHIFKLPSPIVKKVLILLRQGSWSWIKWFSIHLAVFLLFDCTYLGIPWFPIEPGIIIVYNRHNRLLWLQWRWADKNICTVGRRGRWRWWWWWGVGNWLADYLCHPCHKSLKVSKILEWKVVSSPTSKLKKMLHDEEKHWACKDWLSYSKHRAHFNLANPDF